MFPVSMGYFSVLLLLPRCCYFFFSCSLFITFSLFHFIFLYFFSVLSLFISFLLGGSLVLVQVKQVRGFTEFLLLKKMGNGEFVHWGSNHKKKNE